jgi:hypothetical protein
MNPQTQLKCQQCGKDFDSRASMEQHLARAEHARLAQRVTAAAPLEASAEQAIRERAYEIYLERGEQSDAEENWLRAEQEVRQRLKKQTSKATRP